MVKCNYVILENYNNTPTFYEKWNTKGSSGDPCKSNSDCIQVQGFQCSNGFCKRDINFIRSRR